MPSSTILFDLDGVISDTASVHSRAWKMVFDDALRRHQGADAPEFRLPEDYLLYVDGKIRVAGIESFLVSRDLHLPLGGEDDVGLDTIQGIGNTKNGLFRRLLDNEGVSIFGDAERLIRRLRSAGHRLGLASSSKNARIVLDKCGLLNCFDTIMDGLVAEENAVASKPHPDFYRYAAALNDRQPSQCIVVEDAISGVVSAKQAGAGVVIGVSRGRDGAELRANGADLVVETLDEIAIEIFGDAAA